MSNNSYFQPKHIKFEVSCHLADLEEKGLIVIGHLKRVNSIVVSNNKKFLISGSDDYTVRVWNIASGMQVKVMYGHCQKVNSVALVLYDSFAVSASSDRSFCVWNMENFSLQARVELNESVIVCMASAYKSERFILGCVNGTFIVWDVVKSEACYKLQLHTGKISALRMTSNLSLAFSGGIDHKLTVFDLNRLVPISSITTLHTLILCINVTDNYLVSSGQGLIQIHSLPNYNSLTELKFNASQLIRFSRMHGDDKVLYNNYKEFSLMDIHTKQKKKFIKIDKEEVYCVDEIGKSSLVVGSDRTVNVYTTGKQDREFFGHSSFVHDLKFIEGTDFVVTASDDCNVALWDHRKLVCVRVFRGHKAWVRAICVLHRNYFATGGCDNCIKVWNIEKPDALVTIPTQEWVKELTLTQSKKYMISLQGHSLHIYKVYSIRT